MHAALIRRDYRARQIVSRRLVPLALTHIRSGVLERSFQWGMTIDIALMVIVCQKAYKESQLARQTKSTYPALPLTAPLQPQLRFNVSTRPNPAESLVGTCPAR